MDASLLLRTTQFQVLPHVSQKLCGLCHSLNYSRCDYHSHKLFRETSEEKPAADVMPIQDLSSEGSGRL